MDNTSKLLFILLRAAVYPDFNERDTLVEQVDEAGNIWKDLYSLASAQGVLALAFDGVCRVEKEGWLPENIIVPQSLKILWSLNVEKIEERYDHQAKTLEKVTSFFAEYGIKTMVLKGYGLSLLYPVKKHRQYGDLDIWLFGQQKKGDELVRKEFGIKIDNGHHHHTVYKMDGVTVENHYDFVNVHAHPSSHLVEKKLRSLVKERSFSVDIGESKIYLPPLIFSALFILNHNAGHWAASGIKLRNIVDWALMIIRFHDRINWYVIADFAQKMNCDKFLHCMNAVCIDYLGVDQSLIPVFSRDAKLEKRILDDFLHPEFDEKAPSGNIFRALLFKYRRWWTNRWKHRIVYREGLFITFIMQIFSHLQKPKSLR